QYNIVVWLGVAVGIIVSIGLALLLHQFTGGLAGRAREIYEGITMLIAAGCTHPLKQTWQEYRQAKKDGDYEKVALYLADDACIWFDKKEGPGHPLRPVGGPYKDWDKEFRSKSTKENFRIKGRTLSYISYENNDYYRLIERIPSAARVTYYFDEDDKITGMLYAGLTPRTQRPPDRFCEFEKWANE
ncbi:MAG: hypothetical protein IH897_15070, partial [Planctomycetes bacterium]|nr:hypothetical protein [Planctomycetota bacterium]